MATLIQPAYQRDNCQIGVVHIGVGGFHRAHQAFYFDKLCELGHLNWAIAGVNLLPSDKPFVDMLNKRKGQYVLKTISPQGETNYRDIHSIIDSCQWHQERDKAESLLTKASVKIVTMTATESGYYTDENHQLNEQALITEIEQNQHKSIYAYLRIALNKRRKELNEPITLLCCDNLRNNGAVLKQCFERYLSLCGDDELLIWLQNNVSFPCSMVDRITPKPTAAIASEVNDLFGIENDCSVLSEDYLEWVIEDDFRSDKPPLELVGVKFVDSVLPYEERKVRMLNGAHSALTYLAALKGFDTFDEVMSDDELTQFFFDLQTNEIIPALKKDIDLPTTDYLASLQARFSNHYIADSVARICMDGASKIPIYILPTIRTLINHQLPADNAIRAIASWYVFMCYYQNGNINFEYIEPKWQMLSTLLADAVLFANAQVLWAGLEKNSYFVNTLLTHIKDLNERFSPQGVNSGST